MNTDLRTWSSAKTTTGAAAAISDALTNANSAMGSERQGAQAISEASDLRLETAEAKYLDAAGRAYQSHLAALTAMRDRLQVISDIYAAIDGIAAANKSLDAALNSKGSDDKPALASAAVRLKAGRDALTRSGSRIKMAELDRAISLHQRLNSQLAAVLSTGDRDRIFDVASGQASGRAMLLSDRATTLAVAKVNKLMAGVDASKRLFSDAEALFDDASKLGNKIKE